MDEFLRSQRLKDPPQVLGFKLQVQHLLDSRPVFFWTGSAGVKNGISRDQGRGCAKAFHQAP
jgi:hypothetical protein